MEENTDEYDARINRLLGPAFSILNIVANASETGSSNPSASAATPILWALSKSVSRPELSAHDFGPIVESLRRFHQAASGVDDRISHKKIHQPLREIETKLREQATAVDRLLAFSSSDRPFLHALQQTLFLQCPRGGKTAGRFRCVNRTGAPALVDIRARRALAGADESCKSEPAVTFEPTNQRLEPEESATFCVIVDLAQCPNAGEKPIQICADIYLNSELTLKLFVCVEVYDSETHGGITS